MSKICVLTKEALVTTKKHVLRYAQKISGRNPKPQNLFDSVFFL